MAESCDIPKVYLQTVMFREVVTLGPEDGPVDFLWKIGLWKEPTSTGLCQIKPPTAIDAINRNLRMENPFYTREQLGIPAGKTPDPHNREDQMFVFNNLQDGSYNLAVAALVMYNIESDIERNRQMLLDNPERQHEVNRNYEYAKMKRRIIIAAVLLAIVTAGLISIYNYTNYTPVVEIDGSIQVDTTSMQSIVDTVSSSDELKQYLKGLPLASFQGTAIVVNGELQWQQIDFVFQACLFVERKWKIGNRRVHHGYGNHDGGNGRNI